MPEWRFVVARHFGGRWQRQTTCARIKQAVEQRGASEVLPLVRYEIGRAGEYYLGLAVNLAHADDRAVPDVAQEVLGSAGVPVNHLIWPVDPARVAALLRGALDCESFTVPLSFEASVSETIDAGSLVADWDCVDSTAAEADPAESERLNKLLIWCSANGSGNLPKLRDACRALRVTDEWGGAWSVLRRLVMCGHLEFDPASFRWAVLPPTLVQSLEDPERFFLAGQRAPASIELLKNRFTVEATPQDGAPPLLSIRGIPIGQCVELGGRQLESAGAVSERLSRLLPSLRPWIERLPTWDERDFGRFAVEMYDLDADAFRESSVRGRPEAGLYRFTLETPQRRTVTVAFFDVDSNRWICGDYYGLRFLARTTSAKRRVAFRSESRKLLVPVAERWPMPYERALVLASGTLPQRTNTESGQKLFVYAGITEEFAQRICTSLGLDVERV